MIHNLHKKQKTFLKLLVDLNELDIIKLTAIDRRLIHKTMNTECYFTDERNRLDRLRIRFKKPRPNISSKECF